MEAVKLHGMWASSFSLRVEMGLKLKGIPYEYIEEDLRNKSELLLQYNPVYKKVPVLVVDGKPIAESLVILECIDEKWKEHPLLPEDPYMRAKVRFWAKFYDDKLLPGCYAVVLCPEGEEKEKAKKELLENLSTLEEAMEKDFSGGAPFFHGERPGFLDIVLGSSLGSHQTFQEVTGVQIIDQQRTPLLFSWLGALKDLDVVKDTIPSDEKLVPSVRNMILKLPNV